MAGMMNSWKEVVKCKAVAWASVTVLLFTGCASPLRQAGDEYDGLPLPDPELPIEITEESQRRAKALAAYARAQIHEAHREPGKALEAYRRAIEYDPQSEQLYLRLALAYIRAGELDEAADVFQILADRHPDRAQPLLWQGAMLRQLDQQSEAEEIFREALLREPTSTQAYLHLYELLVHQSRMAETESLLIEAIDQVKEPSPLYKLLGEIRWSQSAQVSDESEQAALREGAKAAWEKVLELNPNHAGTWNQLGDLYLQQENIDQAKKHYRQAIQLDPNLTEAKWRLILLYEQRGKYEEAVALLESLSVQQPNNAQVFLSLGAAYEQLGRFDEALRSYRTASRVGRPTTATYLKLAVLQMEEDPEQAIRDLREGLELIPGDPRLLEMLGVIAFQEKNYALTVLALSEAEEFWHSVQGAGESLTPHAPIFLALSYFFMDNLDEAETRLIRAMESSRDALHAFLYFVVQDEDRDRVRQVADFIAPLVNDQPEDIPPLIVLGFLYSFLNDSEAALDALERSYSLAKANEQAEQWLDARFFFWYAAAHERTEQYERAEKLFYRSLELDPESAETYNYLAYMWAELDRNLETAERYVRIALDANPDSAAFIDTLGWIFYRQGRYEEAYTEIRRAAEILPDDPVITDHLGDIYLALGKTEQAIEQWQRALDLDPEDPDEIREKLDEHGTAPSEADESDLDTDIEAEERDAPPPPEETDEAPAEEETESLEADADLEEGAPSESDSK